MADAIVSRVLEQLSSNVLRKAQEAGVSNEVKQLTNNLQAIKDVVTDAEQKQGQNKAVRTWLDQFRNTLYDIEDVLDEWNTSDKVLNDIVASNIREINRKLDTVAKEKDRLNFTVSKSIEKPEPIRSISLIDESVICGRVELKSNLKDKLRSSSKDEKEKKGPHIISLVGRKGIGKTTLAKLIYKDVEVTRNFHKKIWVDSSNHIDELKMAEAITVALDGSNPSSADLESLLQHICKLIWGKTILLVLDDMRIEDYNKWKPIHYCLANCLYGSSKVLITTEKESIEDMVQSAEIIRIEELLDEECWSLFRRFAFFNKSPKETRELEKVGKQIVGKCDHLPLAIKVMGSFLCFKKNILEWQTILNSEMWKVDTVSIENGCVPFLLLSYNDLPSMVKRCFSFCAIFPENHLINKEQLIKLWMAQGYLGLERNEDMEVIGQECFDQLVTRFFFQEFEIDDEGSIISFKMHAMVYDFLQFLNKNECVNGLEEPSIYSNNEAARQSMLMLKKGASFPDSISSLKNLRSLLVHGGVTNHSSVLPKVFDQLLRLRALDISGKLWYENLVADIPSGIKKLIHLRYLNFSLLKLTQLPEELCELYNLQTLELSRCINLKKLPEGIGKLINLRHMVNDETSLNYVPKGFEKLTCLRILREFVVDNGVNGCTVGCLENLTYLQGSLSIKRLGDMADSVEAEKARLKNKKNILHLYLDFEKNAEEGRGSKVDDEVNRNEAILKALQPPPTLERLEIRDYKGNIISPDWLMSLSNLRMLNLHGCMSFKDLPALGELPSLESLCISSVKSLKKVGIEFLGRESVVTSPNSLFIAFPKLKSLRFFNMEEWEEWDSMVDAMWEDFCDSAIMPCLRSLSLVYCPKLKALPNHILQSLTFKELNINWCHTLKQRYNMKTGEDWDKISHIPTIVINFKPVKRESH